MPTLANLPDPRIGRPDYGQLRRRIAQDLGSRLPSLA